PFSRKGRCCTRASTATRSIIWCKWLRCTTLHEPRSVYATVRGSERRAACDIGAYELCTDTTAPRYVALPAGTTTGAGDPAESDDPAAQPYHLHLPLLQSDAGD